MQEHTLNNLTNEELLVHVQQQEHLTQAEQNVLIIRFEDILDRIAEHEDEILAAYEYL